MTVSNAALKSNSTSRVTGSNKLFPKYTKKVTKFGLEVLTGNALSVILLELIDESGGKVFVYKCKLSLALLYLANKFINNLKTKFNSFFFLLSGFK